MKQIPLTQGKYALVDDSDFEWLNQWKWNYNNGYARRIKEINKTREIIYMHRFILKINKEKVCDHINGNGLDNRRNGM